MAETFSSFKGIPTYGYRWVKKINSRGRAMRQPRVLVLTKKQLVMLALDGNVRRRVRLPELQTINIKSDGAAFLPQTASADCPMNVRWYDKLESEPAIDAFLHNLVSLTRLTGCNPSVVHLKKSDSILTLSPPNPLPLQVNIPDPTPVPLPHSGASPSSRISQRPQAQSSMKYVTVERATDQALGLVFNKQLCIVKVLPGTSSAAAGLGAYEGWKVSELNGVQMVSVEQLSNIAKETSTLRFGLLSSFSPQAGQRTTQQAEARQQTAQQAGQQAGQQTALAPRGIERVTVSRAPGVPLGMQFAQGLRVVDVEPGSPSAKSGIEKYKHHRVCELDGVPVATLADIQQALGEDATAVSVGFELEDDDVLLVRRPGERLGAELDKDLKVVSVIPGSPAERAGMAPFIGRYIQRVNGVEVHSVGALALLCPELVTRIVFTFGKKHSDSASGGSTEPAPAEEADDGRKSVVVSPSAEGSTPAAKQCKSRIEVVSIPYSSGETLGVEFNNDLEIVGVVPGSPAAKAGLESLLHKKVVTVNKQPVSNLNVLKKVSLLNVDPVPLGIDMGSLAESEVETQDKRMTDITAKNSHSSARDMARSSVHSLRESRCSPKDRGSMPGSVQSPVQERGTVRGSVREAGSLVNKLVGHQAEATQTTGSLVGDKIDTLSELQEEVASLRRQRNALQSQVPPPRPKVRQPFVPTSWSQSVGLGRMLAFSSCDDDLL